MGDSSVRQRQNKAQYDHSQPAPEGAKCPYAVDDPNRAISMLDVLRMLVTFAVVAVAVSYYTTSGESLIYGYKPWILNAGEVKSWMRGPLQITLEELAKHDGKNPNVPLWLSVNGTVYDVSKGRSMYGPGGGYSVFAGRDASRSFVTGCFQEDTTHDMRGAEEVYLPIEDAPYEKISSGDRKNRAARERREAKLRAYNELKHWVDFFGNSPKYPMVGYVVDLSEPTGPPPPLCAYAQKGRPKRSAQIEQKAAEKKGAKPAPAGGHPAHNL